jgi:soluble lytic murein transglycosylase-like protein
MATKDEIFAFATQEAERQGVPVSLVQNVIEAESGGAFNAIGPKTRFNDRAYGPMQLMSATAKDLGVNRMDWKDNIRGGVKYLGQLSQRFQDPTLVAAAYNAGPGNVEKYGGVPPFKETQNYVKKVVGMANKDDEDWKPVSGINQQPVANTATTQQSLANEDWKPVTGVTTTTAPQPQQTGQSQFLQDVQASFNPMDVLRGKTTSGQLIRGTAGLMASGITGGLSKLGFSDEYLGIDRTKQQPAPQPTQSISDILKGTYKVATERPGLLVGGMATGLLDPANLVLPGAMQKSIVSATPTAIAQAAPRTVALAQNVAAGTGTAGLTSAAQQQATTGTINPSQVFNEAAVGGLLTTPTALTSAVTTPRAPAVLDRKQQIAQAAINQGATLPPSQVNPSLLNSLLEGISGKQTVQQVASIKNQAVINAQARKALGLAEDVEITPQVLQDYRNVKGQAYDALRSNPAYYTDKQFITDINKRSAEIQKRGTLVDATQELNLLNQLKQMRFDGDALVEKIKVLRSDSDVNFRSNDADKLRLAQVQKFAAKQLEDLAERNLTNFNQPDVMKNFKQARQDIAKSYTIEKSLNAATGDVSGAKLGQRAAQGKILPSELQALADAAATYKQSFQNPAAIGSVPMISPLDLGTAAIASAASGTPLVMASALTRPAVRAGITSGMYQRNMLPNTQPQTPGLLNRITSNPMTNYGLGQLPEYGTERFLLNR